MNTITARAHTNIALVKYWGKSDLTRNLPSTGSLSLTLDKFHTTTKLSPAAADSFVLDGIPQTGRSLDRVAQFLDRARQMSGSDQPCHVESHNNFPTASGLASSASAFAALALAASEFFELKLKLEQLIELARLGSGSAARSLFGGFQLINPDLSQETICPPKDFDLSLIIVHCSNTQKPHSSTEAMLHTQNTSPYYDAWVKTHEADLLSAKQAIEVGNLEKLGTVMEHSALKMHASLMAAQPGLWYFNPTTIAVMNRVRELREQDANCYFTMDAGPHVKVLCTTQEATTLAAQFSTIADVLDLTIAQAGPGAYLL